VSRDRVAASGRATWLQSSDVPWDLPIPRCTTASEVCAAANASAPRHSWSGHVRGGRGLSLLGPGMTSRHPTHVKAIRSSTCRSGRFCVTVHRSDSERSPGRWFALATYPRVGLVGSPYATGTIVRNFPKLSASATRWWPLTAQPFGGLKHFADTTEPPLPRRTLAPAVQLVRESAICGARCVGPPTARLRT
jgi:hypothetical protein